MFYTDAWFGSTSYMIGGRDKCRARFVIGLSGGGELVIRGKNVRGIGTLAFCAIPIVVWISQETEIPWSLVGPMVLIGAGAIALVKAFYLREE